MSSTPDGATSLSSWLLVEEFLGLPAAISNIRFICRGYQERGWLSTSALVVKFSISFHNFDFSDTSVFARVDFYDSSDIYTDSWLAGRIIRPFLIDSEITFKFRL